MNTDNTTITTDEPLTQQGAEQATEPTVQTNTETASPPVQFDFKTAIGNADFKRELDAYVNKANTTAVNNALTKERRRNNDNLSESEKLAGMNDKERASYFENKYKEAEKMRARDKELDGLKTQTASMLSENKIPDAFLDVFVFDGDTTAEDITQRVNMLAAYDYFPKGEFEKRLQEGIQAGINEKLKQKAPEQRGAAAITQKDPFEQGFDGD